MSIISRRELLKQASATAAVAVLAQPGLAASSSPVASGHRPASGNRRFRSEAVERYLIETRARIADPELAELFVNCYPNTLDTTVEPGTFEGKPDTAVITRETLPRCGCAIHPRRCGRIYRWRRGTRHYARCLKA